jgi:hypothetical protein
VISVRSNKLEIRPVLIDSQSPHFHRFAVLIFILVFENQNLPVKILCPVVYGDFSVLTYFIGIFHRYFPELFIHKRSFPVCPTLITLFTETINRTLIYILLLPVPLYKLKETTGICKILNPTL